MNRRLRLFLTTDAVGGVWTYSLELAAAVAAEADACVILATVGPAPSVAQQDAAAAIPGVQLAVTDLPLDWTAESSEELQRSAAILAALARAAGADLVQLHAPALATADYGVPLVSVVHSCVATWWAAMRETALPADFAWSTDLARAGLVRSDLVVTPTRAFARAVQQAYGLKALPAAVYNGRTALPLPDAPLSQAAFTAGRLWDEGKNVAAFDAAAGLATTPFRAAGPTTGPNGAEISLAHAQLLGSLTPEQLAEELATRPIFVSPAHYEPFGLAVLEAAQAGCALVLADMPTFRELWDGAALFVEPSADQIAATVDLLAATPDERERLGQAARERAARYTPQMTARAMLGHYRALLGTERRAAA